MEKLDERTYKFALRIIKMAIALKEARETHYWLRLIRDANLVSAKRIDSLIQEALEIKLILAQAVITSKKSKVKSEK